MSNTSVLFSTCRPRSGWRTVAWPPPGSIVTYTEPGTTPGERPSTATGIITARPEQSIISGRILVPVRRHTDPLSAATHWVALADILILDPSGPGLSGQEPEHGESPCA